MNLMQVIAYGRITALGDGCFALEVTFMREKKERFSWLEGMNKAWKCNLLRANRRCIEHVKLYDQVRVDGVMSADGAELIYCTITELTGIRA